jgi:hypothetical protein
MRCLPAVITIGLAIFSSAIFAQTIVMNIPAVLNRPFVANENHEGQRGFSGTLKIARNSNGSIYFEAPEGTIYIFDVPNKTVTTLYVGSKSYRVNAMPQLFARVVSDEYVANLAAHSAGARPNHAEQNGVTQDGHSLGAMTVQGFVALGHLTTNKGTDEQGRTVDNTSETWESPLVGILSSRFVDHAGNRSSTMVRENFQMVEPDPALFRVPPGYTLVQNPPGPGVTAIHP